MPLRFLTDTAGVSRRRYRMLRMWLLIAGALVWAGLSLGLVPGMQGVNILEAVVGSGAIAQAVYALVGLAGVDALLEQVDVY